MFDKILFDLRILLIQPDILWESTEANLLRYTDMIRSTNRPVHLIVLPEMFATGYTMNAESCAEKMDGRIVNWMRTMAKETHSVIVGGLAVREGNSFFNRCLTVFPDEQNMRYYDKHHLVSVRKEDQVYKSGLKQMDFILYNWKIRPIVCYDLRFPVWCRNTSHYDILLVIANWPESRQDAWIALARARAIENQAWVVAVNRTGIDGENIIHVGGSLVVAPDGSFLLEPLPAVEKLIELSLPADRIQKVRDSFPTLRNMDHFSFEEPH